MNKSKNLGHDPRHINEDSAKAHWRIRMQGLFTLLAGIAIVSFIIFMAFCLCSCASPIYRHDGVISKTWSYTINVGDKVERIESVSCDTAGPRFEFKSVSQFLVFADTIEEYHMSQRIIGLDDRIVLTTSTESDSPAFFPITDWAHLNDSTILGWSGACAAEYQVRWGKSAVRVDFFDPNKGKAYFLAFEFWCDSTNVR